MDTTKHKKQNKPHPLSLMLFFIKIGCFTFGGGWSILSQMDQEFVQKHQWLTDEELLDITSVARSMPGIMITNISIIFGHQMCGVLGAIACTIGIAIPSVVILTVVTFFYGMLKDNLYVTYILQGIRSAVVPIILVSVIRMWKSAIKDKICLIFLIIACVLSLFAPVGNIEIVILGIIAALILAWIKGGKGKNALS